jgi:hypothetical protein
MGILGFVVLSGSRANGGRTCAVKASESERA